MHILVWFNQKISIFQIRTIGKFREPGSVFVQVVLPIVYAIVGLQLTRFVRVSFIMKGISQFFPTAFSKRNKLTVLLVKLHKIVPKDA